ncbi:MAG: hypothetical protein QXQ53_01265 [Candidatus Methanosuratincola sp.]
MKEIEIVAKAKDKLTGKMTEIKGKCKQYASLNEAVKDMGGEEKVLAIVNMHVKIRALDSLRRGSTPSVFKAFKTASPEAQKKIMEILGIKA